MWINEGLMAIFFYAVTIEVKHEVLYGVISSTKKLMLPLFGALGGMLVPILFYMIFNHHDPITINGWAIPVATDIAFAVGLVTFFKDRIPLAFRTLLLSIAVLDDIGSILIIAIYYTDNLNLLMFKASALMMVILLMLNRLRVRRKLLYVAIAVLNWYFLVNSGVHATLSGVILAMAYPINKNSAHSILEKINPAIYLMILPLFAFCNAGVVLGGNLSEVFWHPVTVGVIAGLVIGKPIGILMFSWIAVKAGWCVLPNNLNWKSMLPLGFICGIGFTMSLFFGTLAFENDTNGYVDSVKLGVLIGSFVSAVLGYLLLKTQFKLGIKYDN